MGAFDVRGISKAETLEMVRRYHYSDTLPKINRHFLGFYRGGGLVGVMTLGYGTRPRHTIQRLFPSLDTKDYYEIGRMCMTDEMPRNSESQMISACVKWLKRNDPQIKVLFTWADGILGKPGYVYQACSFEYAGYIESEIYLMNGTKLHPRKMKKQFQTDVNDKRVTIRPSLQQMREMGIEHYKGRQFRYFKFLCSKPQRTLLRKEQLIPTEHTYPKASELKWRKKNLVTGKWEESEKPLVITDNSSEQADRDDIQMRLF